MQLWWMHWMERYVTIRTALLLTWSNDLHTSSWWGPDLVTLVIIMYLFPLQRKWSFSLHVYWCQGEQGDCAILLCWVYFIWSLTNESRDNKDSDICYIFFFFNQSSLKHICVTVFFIPSLYPSKGLITGIRS